MAILVSAGLCKTVNGGFCGQGFKALAKVPETGYGVIWSHAVHRHTKDNSPTTQDVELCSHHWTGTGRWKKLVVVVVWEGMSSIAQ